MSSESRKAMYFPDENSIHEFLAPGAPFLNLFWITFILWSPDS